VRLARFPDRPQARRWAATAAASVCALAILGIAFGSAGVGMAASSAALARPSCTIVPAALISGTLGEAVAPATASPWDRGTLNCSYHFLHQPKAGTDLVLIGYLTHATTAQWRKLVADAHSGGHGVITPAIGNAAAVAFIEFTTPSNSDSVIAVRDGKTVFTILTIPELNFLGLEQLARKMLPLVRT
jgi:hypothetical protein